MSKTKPFSRGKHGFWLIQKQKQTKNKPKPKNK